ncbi:hypothetical protein E2C01_065253 [Portunus trituberculatus]|uniref:Uncharacterized protein n=1 Tax=Portunus trituberculatus TaxID=210409 RepID=A0A5B7HMW9_PORTR|nr:hypothetical protein [Portunus trituberculatus]
MVPELKDLTYEERLKEMGLPTLQDRRERGNLITMNKIVNGIEKIDKEDLVLLTKEDGRTRGHEKKIRIKQCVKNIGKYNFLYRTMEKWNAFNNGIVTAHSKAMLLVTQVQCLQLRYPLLGASCMDVIPVPLVLGLLVKLTACFCYRSVAAMSESSEASSASRSPSPPSSHAYSGPPHVPRTDIRLHNIDDSSRRHSS